MNMDIAKGDTLWFDTLFFLGTVLVSFGLGARWHIYVRDNPAAILLYAAILFIVYVHWVAKSYKETED